MFLKSVQGSPKSLRYLMLGSCILTCAGHIFLLRTYQLDWIQTPISALSQNGNAVQHTTLLCLFALSQALLAANIRVTNNGLLTKSIQSLCLLTAALIASLGWVFAVDNPALHRFMLSLIASVVGLIMACLIARDRRHPEQSTAFKINTTALLIWTALIPIAFVAGDSFIGAYQRSVGGAYVAWLCALAITPANFCQKRAV